MALADVGFNAGFGTCSGGEDGGWDAVGLEVGWVVGGGHPGVW